MPHDSNGCFTEKRVLLFIFVVATSLFAFHAFTIFSRFSKYEILEIHKIVSNKSLPLPMVVLQLESMRHPNSTRAHAHMLFNVSLNLEPLPLWAYVNESIRVDDTLWQECCKPELFASLK